MIANFFCVIFQAKKYTGIIFSKPRGLEECTDLCVMIFLFQNCENELNMMSLMAGNSIQCLAPAKNLADFRQQIVHEIKHS